MVGRISPIKHVELGLQAVRFLVLSGAQISFTIAGPVANKDLAYYDTLKKFIVENNLSASVTMSDIAPFSKHPEIYSSHEICLNLTDPGSFDKSIVGAASCGAIPLVSNTSLSGLLPDVCFTKATPEAICVSIQHLLQPHLRVEVQPQLEVFVESQSLARLIEKLSMEMQYNG